MVKRDKASAAASVKGSTKKIEQRLLEEIGESLFISRVELALVSRKLEHRLNTTSSDFGAKNRRQNWAKQQCIIIGMLQCIEPLEADFRLATN